MKKWWRHTESYPKKYSGLLLHIKFPWEGSGGVVASETYCCVTLEKAKSESVLSTCRPTGAPRTMRFVPVSSSRTNLMVTCTVVE